MQTFSEIPSHAELYSRGNFTSSRSGNGGPPAQTMWQLYPNNIFIKPDWGRGKSDLQLTICEFDIRIIVF